jgi:transposase-like protein/cephalosporin hydroxylase
MKKKPNSTYSRKIKDRAISRVVEHGASIRTAAKELGVPRSTLAGWLKKRKAPGPAAPARHSPRAVEQVELEVLREEVAALRAELDEARRAEAAAGPPLAGPMDITPHQSHFHEVGPHDSSLLDRSREQWQHGDWDSLVALAGQDLDLHPDRAKLALLAAAGYQQNNDMVATRHWLKLAQEWGCDKKLVARVLIAGVHNTLGRAAVVNNQEQRALYFFQSANVGHALGVVPRALLKQARKQLGSDTLSRVHDCVSLADNHVAPPLGVTDAVKIKVAKSIDEITANPYVHNRRMTKALNKSLREFFWVCFKKENFKATYIDYLASKAIEIEKNCVGRLATTLQDAVVRQVVAESVAGPHLGVLEIGSLFGVNLAILYNHCVVSFETMKVVGLDPLAGYYGKAMDAVLNTPINRQTFLRNMHLGNVPTESYELIQHYSTDPEALDRARRHRINLLIIDGDHSYDGVKFDYEHYFPLLEPGGYVIFDDYNAKEWPDVTAFVDQVVKEDARCEFVGAFSRTAIGRKRNSADGR